MHVSTYVCKGLLGLQDLTSERGFKHAVSSVPAYLYGLVAQRTYSLPNTTIATHAR
jgi:hypothetical protein